MADMNDQLSREDRELIAELQGAYASITSQLGKVIVGQKDVIEQLLICIFARGHALLVGVPGLAKTLLVRTLADTLELKFSRIQFTPDLMPSDITGTEVLQEDKATGERGFKFIPGPVFANIVLADEINRTPPKTQAALLEAMQEHQVTAGGRRHALKPPFFVLATQNPVEQEGTYPLPEAQQDRFMFNIRVDYPNEEEELEVMKRTTTTSKVQVENVLNGEKILKLQEVVRRIPVSDHIIRYAMTFARMSRREQPEAPEFIRKSVQWGAGPRASQFLVLGAKAHAALNGRHYVSGADVRKVLHPVLRHRILPNFEAEASGITSDTLIDRLAEVISSEGTGVLNDDRLPKATA